MSVLATELRVKTEAIIEDLAPEVSVGVRHDREGTYLDLPAAPKADYRFSLYVGEPQIHAVLVGSHTGRRFWYWPFAEQDYASLEEQEKHFLECVRLLLRFPTQVTQRRTLLGATPRCEADTEKGVAPIGGSLGVWFGVPKISGRERVHRSRPMASTPAV